MECINKHFGWLRYGETPEGHETVFLNGEPIAGELDYLWNQVVTLRYYISDKELTEEELQEDFLINTLYGNLESDYNAVYTEYTGYLWTDDELNVGGHDLLRELKSHDGKYIFLIVEIDEKVYQENQEKKMDEVMQNIIQYELKINDLIRAAKNRDIQKSLDQVINDIKSRWG